VVIRRQLKRRFVLAFFQKLPPCLVGIEACASSHYWSRELQALGHTVRLMPPAYVKHCADGLGHDGQGRALQATVALAAQTRSRRTAGVMRRLGGRTARNAEPVDPAIRTPHLCQRIVECGLLTGT
jgi:transposase